MYHLINKSIVKISKTCRSADSHLRHDTHMFNINRTVCYPPFGSRISKTITPTGLTYLSTTSLRLYSGWNYFELFYVIGGKEPLSHSPEIVCTTELKKKTEQSRYQNWIYRTPSGRDANDILVQSLIIIQKHTNFCP